MTYRLTRLLAGAIAAACAMAAMAHDPSAYGGLYRSRDLGATWFTMDAGLFVGSATAVAVHPRDANHVLYGTDNRLLRSRNGGRDWAQEGGNALQGPIFAVAFGEDGSAVYAANSTQVFRCNPQGQWAAVNAPRTALPVFAFLSDGHSLLAATPGGLYTVRDGGNRWDLERGLPPGAVTAITRAPSSTLSALMVVAAGRPWQRLPSGLWQAADTGLPVAVVDALYGSSDGFWASVGNQVFRSPDGERWAPAGQLPDAALRIRALAAVAGGRIVLAATPRGLMRSDDGGVHWGQQEGNLPLHLEGSPLIVDQGDPPAIYTGFSLAPYDEMRRRADEAVAALPRFDRRAVVLFAVAAGLAAVLLAAVVLAVTRSKRRRAVRARTIPVTTTVKRS